MTRLGGAVLVCAALASCARPTAPRGPVPGERHARPEGARASAAEPEVTLASIWTLDATELEALWPALAGRPGLRAHAALRRALLAAHRGDRGAARQWLGRYRDSGGGDAETDARAEALAADLAAAGEPRAGVLALALPLSGGAAALGDELRRSVELAVRGAAGAELRVFDTGGTEAGAVAAIERAAAEGAALVLGPIGARESSAAARRAAELGLPVALLSPSVAGAAPSRGIFRLWTPPRWEAEQAALAAVELGFDSLAVLAPRDEVGDAQARAFVRAAEGAGARVVADGRYDPSGAALQADLRAFLGLDPRTDERLRRHLRRHGQAGWKTFSPDVPFELLYVPDGVDRGALVASYLPYLNVELRTHELMDQVALRRKHGGRIPSVVQLLGSSGWNHPSVIARGGAAVEGALVLDACPGTDTIEPLSPASAAFAEAFQRAYGRPPSRAAAQAHDAARLAIAALASSSAAADPRAGASAALARARLVDGACGPAELRAGELVRQIVLLQVGRDELRLHEW